MNVGVIAMSVWAKAKGLESIRVSHGRKERKGDVVN